MDYSKSVSDYFKFECEIIQSLDVNEISQVMNVLEEARTNGHRIFICGNGGSAATASHFCCDFNKGVSHDRDQKERYDFECLNDNVPTMMAIANDIDYADVFLIPLINKMKSKDVFIGISGSGNSENVVRAMKYANEHGGITVAIVGYDGGKIKDLAKHCIHVNCNNMQIVEDIHMAIDHVMMYVLSGKRINHFKIY